MFSVFVILVYSCVCLLSLFFLSKLTILRKQRRKMMRSDREPIFVESVSFIKVVLLQNITFIMCLYASEYHIYFFLLFILSYLYSSSIHQNTSFISFLYVSKYHIYFISLAIKIKLFLSSTPLFVKISQLFHSCRHQNIRFISFL